jgi:hypothetical protein
MQSTTIAKSVTSSEDRQGRTPIDVWAVGAVIGFAVFFGMLGVLCWGLDRGFDPLVEGFYMLSSQNPQIYPTFSSFHFFLSKIPPFIANEIIRFRVVELAGRIAGALLLAFGFGRWCGGSLRLNLSKQMFLTALTCVGALFTLCFFPRTCSYNGLASIFVVASAGFMFLGLAPHRVAAGSAKGQQFLARFLPAVLLMASGFIAGLGVFDKFTTGLGLLAMIAVFLFSQRRFSALLHIVLGVGGAAAVYFGFFQSASDWWRIFIEAVTLEGRSSHQVATLPLDLAALYRTHAKHLFGACLAVLIFTELFKKSAVERNVFRLLIGTTCAVFLILAVTRTYIFYETYGIILALTALFTALVYPIMSDLKIGKAKASTPFDGATSSDTATAGGGSDDASRLEQRVAPSTATGEGTSVAPAVPGEQPAEPFIGKAAIFGMAFVLLLPCLASAGTNTDPVVHVGITLAPWFMLVALGCILCDRRYGAPYTASLFAIALVVFSFIHFVHQGVYERQDGGDITKFDTPVTGVPVLNGIKLRARDADSYQESLHILQANGFRENDPLICLYDDPGLVYAMHATSPGQAWYIYWPERDELNAHYMKQARLANDARVFLVTTCTNCFGPKLLEVLNQQGFSFKTFRVIGEARSPLTGGSMHFSVHENAGEKSSDKL